MASPLLRLSPELRNLIYEFVLTDSTPIDLTFQCEPALTRTSRQLRTECLLLYYSLNAFTLTCSASSRFPLASADRLRAMKHLTIEYHLTSGENQPELLRCGSWLAWMRALARADMGQFQVEWTAVSSDFDGGNYYVYLAEAARLRLYQELIEEDWTKTIERGSEETEAAAGDSEESCESSGSGCLCGCCSSGEWDLPRISTVQ